VRLEKLLVVEQVDALTQPRIHVFSSLSFHLFAAFKINSFARGPQG
jgi:hypothetical protein